MKPNRFPNTRLILLGTIFSLLFLYTQAFGSSKFVYDHAQVLYPQGESTRVEISDTPEKRQLGLGQREHLSKNQGMLFIFEQHDQHGFWMKDMRCPIDIIWLDNYRIVHIEHKVPPPAPGQEPVIIKPDTPSNIVLELVAGQANQHQLKVGQTLRFRFE